MAQAKNRNNAGTIHFDAGTNQHYVERRIRFEFLGKREMTIAIPLRMIEILKTEHFDRALIAWQRQYDHTFRERVKTAGIFTIRNAAEINQQAEKSAKIAYLEELYNLFIVEQARLGNEMWAVPELMQEVGPRPEDDLVS